MNEAIDAYNRSLSEQDEALCGLLRDKIDANLPDANSKLWHGHPVWFLDGNPIVGYSKVEDGIQLLFWSGDSFEEDGLAFEGSFKAAEVRFTHVDDVDTEDLDRWLGKAREIQWDYKNLVKRKGQLERLR
jgi:hypothetical protein